jgi:hypothetical protein
MAKRRAPKTVVAAFRTIIQQHELHLAKLVNDHWIKHGTDIDWLSTEPINAYYESQRNLVHNQTHAFKLALQQLASIAGLEEEYNIIKIEEINEKLDQEAR